MTASPENSLTPQLQKFIRDVCQEVATAIFVQLAEQKIWISREEYARRYGLSPDVVSRLVKEGRITVANGGLAEDLSQGRRIRLNAFFCPRRLEIAIAFPSSLSKG